LKAAFAKQQKFGHELVSFIKSEQIREQDMVFSGRRVELPQSRKENRMEQDYVVILITAPNQEVSENLASALVEEKLAACVNIISPILSIYRWHGQVEREQEFLLLCKTRRELFDAKFITAVRAIHPYEVPEMVALPIQAGYQDYLNWITAETHPVDP
jgi:periplasmic divalent cation tolerance protein